MFNLGDNPHMKKTLIAFAALSAIAGVAQAQSSVTLYGLVDAYVGQTSVGSAPAPSPNASVAKLKQNVVNGSGQNNSRWGLRGTEDLGGGLKGSVPALEGGFQPDTGAFRNDLQPRRRFVRSPGVGWSVRRFRYR